MISKNVIIVWDLETLGLDHNFSDVIQIAALAIDPQSLTIIPNSKFESLIKPENTKTDEDWDKAQGALAKNGKKREILEKAPLSEHVWKDFHKYVNKYRCGNNTHHNRPIAAGHNIIGFDLLFLNRYAQQYGLVDKNGLETFFSRKAVLDTLTMSLLWFGHVSEPEKHSLDVLRPWLGYTNENSHDAFQDILFTSDYLIRFMKLHRHFAKKVRFKGSFGVHNDKESL